MSFKRHDRPTFLRSVLSILFLLFLAQPGQAAENKIDNDIWAELLAKYVQNGVVDYAGFQSDEEKLDLYLKELAAHDPEDLTRDARFAFYVNVYNAWTVKLILTAYPDIKSIKELGNIFKTAWEKPIVQLANGTFTLDDIEHGILRPRFKDPRIHFVVNCASISCPPLRSEPYTAERLEAQLEDATRRFLNHPDNHRLDGTDFYVSRLFKWYGEDFDNDAIGFYLKYADEDLKARLQAAGQSLDVKYLKYDWGLNGN
jgi:hypothetical protein